MFGVMRWSLSFPPLKRWGTLLGVWGDALVVEFPTSEEMGYLAYPAW